MITPPNSEVIDAVGQPKTKRMHEYIIGFKLQLDKLYCEINELPPA
jgi:hypothetical protein